MQNVRKPVAIVVPSALHRKTSQRSRLPENLGAHGVGVQDNHLAAAAGTEEDAVFNVHRHADGSLFRGHGIAGGNLPGFVVEDDDFVGVFEVNIRVVLAIADAGLGSPADVNRRGLARFAGRGSGRNKRYLLPFVSGNHSRLRGRVIVNRVGTGAGLDLFDFLHGFKVKNRYVVSTTTPLSAAGLCTRRAKAPNMAKNAISCVVGTETHRAKAQVAL
jgi:hypothetical protein